MTVLANDGNGNITYRTQIEADAKIYDAWGPDFIVTNPVKATNTVGEVGDISLGEDIIPGHTGTSPLVTIENDSAYNMQPGLDVTEQPAAQASQVDDIFNPVHFAPFRYRVTVADLRRREVPLPDDDWNSTLSNDAYLFGTSPSAGSLWDGFRYDPYREYHIPMGDWNFDLPNGVVLREGQTVPLRLTRMIPRHQPDSVDNGYYQTPQSEWLKETAPDSNRWYLDINKNDQYDIGVDFMQNWPSWSQLYLDRNLNGVYNPGEPCLAVGSFDTALYLDINANGVRDRFEPSYSPAANAFSDYGSRLPNDYPQGISTKLGVAPIIGFRLRNTMFDLGSYALGSPYVMPPLTASLANSGNNQLAGIQVRGGSLAMLVNQDQTSWLRGASGELYRTGFAATRAENTTVELRPTAEIQPFIFNMALPEDWTILKSPAGALMDYGRDFQFAIPGINYRQPSGTYAGVLSITNNGFTDANSMISLRVRENRFSQVAPGLSGIADPRPDIDGTRNANVPTWTNYLTGTESWPTATVLPDGDLGVFVSSDTPSFTTTATLTELQPAATTDTNIWYRRAKRLIYDARPATPTIGQHYAAFTGVNVTSITLFPVGQGVKVRRGVSPLVSDLVVLRKRIANAGEAPVPAWYGQITNVQGDTLTVAAVNPGYSWAYPDSETIVEVMGHPWMQIINNNDMDMLRNQLKDPGTNLGPKPIRCITPSVTQVSNGLPWLAWSVSTVRTVTNPQSGQKDSFPFSYLAFKRFDSDNPDNSSELTWVSPKIADGAKDLTLSFRETTGYLTIRFTRNKVADNL